MAEEKPQELLIIKRSRSSGHGSHGGAWKIAFADFMTAMMALFLVLWLISATNEKTKASLARYFNPVKLVDMTIQKRGLNDPQEHPTENAVDNAPPPTKALSPSSPNGKVPKPSKSKSQRSANYQPTYSEAALFRDPYAVLAKIAGTGSAETASQVDHPNVGASANFQDPFQTAVPGMPKPPSPPPAAAAAKGPAAKSVSAPAPAPVPSPAPLHTVAPSPAAKPDEKASASSALAPAASAPPKEAAASAAKAAKTAASTERTDSEAKQQTKQPPHVEAATKREAARLRQEISKALGKSAAPSVAVQSTPQGVLISLTDGIDYAMFAIGSAEPQRRSVQIMEKIAHILKKEKGSIVISGHTDGRRYRTRTYDNWRLSTARAQMALYMLVRGGLDERRVERIEGAADHDLKVPSDPLAAQNRRIEILLREKS